MIRYKLKGNNSAETYMEIIEEKSNGFVIAIIKEFENCKKSNRDFISRELFASCLRTGSLIKVGEADLMTA